MVTEVNVAPVVDMQWLIYIKIVSGTAENVMENGIHANPPDTL